MKTEKIQTPKPEVEMISMSTNIISIKLGDRRLLIETASNIGIRFAYISIRDENCIPHMRVATPLWVWRWVKKMIRSGKVDSVNDFILQVFKEFAAINAPDRALGKLGKPNYDRIYYEEPYRLLSILFL